MSAHAEQLDYSQEHLAATLSGLKRFEWEQKLRALDAPRLAHRGRVDGSTVKLVALTLATYANDDGTGITVGQERLAENTGKSEGTVSHALAVLRRRGYLRRVRRGSNLGRRSQADQHELTVPPARNLSTATLRGRRVVEDGTPCVDAENTLRGRSGTPCVDAGLPTQIPTQIPTPGAEVPPELSSLWTEWGWDEDWKARAWVILCNDPETRSPSKRGTTAWFRSHARELLQAEDKQQRERQGQRLRDTEPPCPHGEPAGLAPVLNRESAYFGQPRCGLCRADGAPVVLSVADDG